MAANSSAKNFPPQFGTANPSTANSLALQEEKDDSEWEYEYSQHETENFYITLDLTSHVPLTSRKRKRGKEHDGAPLNAARRTTVSQDFPKDRGATHGSALLDANNAPSDQNPRNTRSFQESGKTHTQGGNHDRVQILDLASSDPLISYGGELYTCEWASAPGTDLLFTSNNSNNSDNPPSSSPSSNHLPQPMPLHSTPKYNLLAATSVRLIARPAYLRPHPRPPQRTTMEVLWLEAPPSQPDADSAPLPPLQPIPFHTMSQRKAQSAFLQRLRELKSRRGDDDVVPTYTNTRGGGRPPLNPSTPQADAGASPPVAVVASNEDTTSAGGQIIKDTASVGGQIVGNTAFTGDQIIEDTASAGGQITGDAALVGSQTIEVTAPVGSQIIEDTTSARGQIAEDTAFAGGQLAENASSTSLHFIGVVVPARVQTPPPPPLPPGRTVEADGFRIPITPASAGWPAEPTTHGASAQPPAEPTTTGPNAQPSAEPTTPASTHDAAAPTTPKARTTSSRGSGRAGRPRGRRGRPRGRGRGRGRGDHAVGGLSGVNASPLTANEATATDRPDSEMGETGRIVEWTITTRSGRRRSEAG